MSNATITRTPGTHQFVAPGHEITFGFTGPDQTVHFLGWSCTCGKRSTAKTRTGLRNARERHENLVRSTIR